MQIDSSGIAEPSEADELVTRRLRDALALGEIRRSSQVKMASH
jgi:hypothetical protein